MKKLIKKLKQMGVDAQTIKKLMSLSNPNVSREILCEECFKRMFVSARDKQQNPQVLFDRVCDKCKKALEDYLK